MQYVKYLCNVVVVYYFIILIYHLFPILSFICTNKNEQKGTVCAYKNYFVYCVVRDYS